MPTELKDARNCPGTAYLGGDAASHYWDVKGGEFRPSVNFWAEFGAEPAHSPHNPYQVGTRVKLEVCPKCWAEHEWRSKKDAKSGREFVRRRMGEAVVKQLLK